MDVYLVDTNVVSALLRGNNPSLTQRSRSVPTGQQVFPSIVRAELFFGWTDSPHFASRMSELDVFLAGFPTAEFDDKAAREYGKLCSVLKQSGQMIGANDLIIASVALAHRLVLVTHNSAEFSRVPGL